jgi:hypothetical protein
MIPRGKPALAVVALTLLVCSLALTALVFLPHAEETCPAGLHCVTCRHALGATPTLAAAAPVPALFTPVVAPAVEPPVHEIRRPRAAVPARAPPVPDQA